MTTKNAELDLTAYVHLWGARYVPFLDQSEPVLFHTEQTQQALEFLQQTAALRSVLLLSGDNGCGKSLLVAQWLKTLSPKVYLPLVVTQASLSASGLLSALVSKLGRTPSGRRSKNLIEIEEALNRLGRIIPLLVLDEAQDYSPSALEEVRLLLGLNLAPQPVFALVLIADNYLLDTLRLQSRRPLLSRIALAYQLPALTPAQVVAYLTHATQQAGLHRECFEPTAVELLTAASDGILRTVNLLARAAWIEASRQQATLITAQHVQRALRLVPAAREKAGLPITP
jgi:type II secretory pathway predicted ATPase ExeA